MRFESRTGMAALRLAQAAEQETLSRIGQKLDDIRRLMMLRREMKYSPDQPRDWHGRWTDGGGGEAASGEGTTESGESFGEAPDGTPVDKIGGIPDDKLNWTTQQFMSAYCLGRIREVMPGQFLNMPIAEVIERAKQGDPAANRCWKLLREDRFRK